MIDIHPHAPAPWEVTPDGQGIKAVHGQNGMDPSELMPVAVLSPGVCREGNARLIAAAPGQEAKILRLKVMNAELLKVCRTMLERMDQLIREEGGYYSGVVATKDADTIRAALARAEGGPQCST